jgi:hypothetical protein
MTRKILATALLLVIVTLKVHSQATISGQAFAEVISALTADENSQMHFGRFSPEISGGQIVLSPEGVRTAEGSVMLGGGMSQPGKFIITGEANATFSIQLPTGPAQLVHNGSNKTMTVDEWVSIPPAGDGTGTLQDGREIVSVGATLTVGSMEDNPVGIYTGTYSLTFAYN